VITKSYVRTSVGQVHLRSAGVRRADRLPLVLLHQTASSSAMYERLMGLLADDFYMVAPDTPGFGGTEPLAERASIARYADVLVEALQRLEIDRCLLFGHHSGASIAVQIAHSRPALVERLVLSGPPYLTKAQLEAIVPSVSPVALHEDGSHLLSVWKRIRSKDPQAPVELSHREAVLNLIAGTRYPEAYDAVFAHDLPGQLPTITCPTLVVIGPDDTIRASAEPAAKALPNGRLHVFPRGGTYICDREPELMAGALRDFCQGA
jgi:pimeloyl-ACP methyl ester carboxylesterase